MISLLVWIVISFVPAFVGSQFMPGEWYTQLRKPSWTPPGYLFGPVWSLLYLSMGVAAWLVWKRGGYSGAPVALTLFLIQLVFNGLWSWLFFGLQRPGLAFVDIAILWILVLATTLAFWRQGAAAGTLMIPYITWLSFASALNFSIWRMNAGS
ncbi:TspO protein [candidate division GN15 bacterium]|uniref:TspO protein n=1 Tax=candidate division GN15 bacterium TaxID=2072418 RepID=A0A855X7F3_9BACT|nr:MAG: TspO protein [candidate division GN15 bacterium]